MHAIYQLLAVVAAATLTSTRMVRTSSDEEKNFELLILHNNDMHARFEQTSQQLGTCTPDDREKGKCYGGFARVAHVVKEARLAAATGTGPPVLYLNAGDTYTGSAWFTLYKWKIAAEFINAIQPDAMSLGNHEFDLQVDGAVNFINRVNSPVLAANLLLDDVPELKNEPNLKSSIILTINNVNIGIIGYLTPDTKDDAPNNKVEYEDEIVAIRREATKLKKLGVNILIALGHSGIYKDLNIACFVEDIDIVVGGHSHTFLWNTDTDEIPETPVGNYPIIIKQESGRSVAVVQAFAFTKYMGKINLIFDSNYELNTYNATPILLNRNVPEDPDLLELVRNYRSKVDKLEPIGTSTVGLDATDCRIKECNIGNLINDAFLYYIKDKYNQNFSNVNIAITQGGRIRTSIDPSREETIFNMTKEDWINVLPFTDTLSLVTMNGSTLKQALEHSITDWSAINRPGHFLQFSGVKVVYDLSKPVNNRVVDAKAVSSTNPELGLYEIKENFEYKVIMNSFLANTGNGYKMFENLPRIILPFDELKAISAYLKAKSPISPVATDRITIMNIMSDEKTNMKQKRLEITDDFCLRMKRYR